MSDIAADVARVSEALAGPRLKLVNAKWAPIVLAVLGAAFGPQSKSVKAERLHALVDQYLKELEDLRFEVPPNAQGRALCMEWMQNRWLKRVPHDEGGEAYELTSDALAAQRVVEGMARDQTTLSESRLTTIISTVRRWAREANPDRAARIASLDEEIARLAEERDRLSEGGELVNASDDRMLTGFLDVTDLVAQLPGDFRRVEEQIEVIHKQMLQAFRSEDRPKGEILDEYLEASERLTEQTEEGKAFEGALSVLSDDTLLETLRMDLRTIVSHPFSEALTAKERLSFVNMVSILRTGLQDIQLRQMKTSYTLQEQLTSQDTAQERDLNAVLRSLNHELDIWMTTARPRDQVPMAWMPQRIEIEHLHTRFYDPAVERPAPDIEDVSAEAPEPLSLDEVRRFGGPLVNDVRAGIVEALSSGAQTLGFAFNQLEPGLRRPVEIFGVLEMATQAGLMELESSTAESVLTVRPDGTERVLLVPQWRTSAEQIRSAEVVTDV